MAVIGAVDTSMDAGHCGDVARAGWKTTLGAAGLFLNIGAFSSGKFENETFLYAYLGTLAAVGSAALLSLIHI